MKTENDLQRALFALKIQKIILDNVDNQGVLERAIIGNLDSVRKALDANLGSIGLMVVQETYLLTKNRMKQIGIDTEKYDKQLYSLMSREINIKLYKN